MNVILIVATIIYMYTQCNWYEKYVERVVFQRTV